GRPAEPADDRRPEMWCPQREVVGLPRADVPHQQALVEAITIEGIGEPHDLEGGSTHIHACDDPQNPDATVGLGMHGGPFSTLGATPTLVVVCGIAGVTGPTATAEQLDR